ncbi:protease modulator HflC [Phenylobacterium sp.]|uniref:protease modulator HflC n=1 Tax=Phenylobacterium sp. TaxID=1871053 RepID=UPI002735AA85|nr:protease modulator HflC [Phenylobacterium sp.]MDP3855850.1 protease modulator HflC [Phenylobacterium sp.]
MNRSLTVLGIIVFGVLIVLSQTFFIVDQRKQAVIVRLGEPVRVINAPGDPAPGLKIKMPFAENVIFFEKRNLAIEAAQEEITASDQNRLVVDAFVRYRISNPLLYYRTLRDEQTASDRIERLVNSSLRQVLGSATSNEIISGRRGALMAQTKADVVTRAKSSGLGIEIIDVRIKRADLPPQIQESVYRRMQTSRQQEAARIRSQGEQEKREIIAGADKEVAITLATARQEAETTRGEGDALRTRLFAQGYGKDPAFAAFYRSMAAYEASLGQGDTTMVLSPDSAFFKYFERGPNAR